MPALDRYRGDGEDETRDTYDGRLFREEVFVPLVREGGRGLGGDATSTRWSLSDPDCRMGAGVAQGLGIGDDRLVSAAPRRGLGDLGAAAALAGAMPADRHRLDLRGEPRHAGAVRGSPSAGLPTTAPA